MPLFLLIIDLCKQKPSAHGSKALTFNCHWRWASIYRL